MSRRRDRLAVHNERMKLLAGLFNAIGIGLIGFAVLRPFAENAFIFDPVTAVSTGFGIAFHGAAHDVLARLKKDVTDDTP